MDSKKGIAILGSTGSIGTQALDVIKANQDKFDLHSHRDLDLRMVLHSEDDKLLEELQLENCWSRQRQVQTN